jgi:2-oxoglutarate ferredoxin oxidoreductase subunit beta
MPNYKSQIIPTWCPGCNNFLVYSALQNAFSALNLSPHNIFIAYDIGCAGNMADFFKAYGAHTLHGRSPAFAMGVKLIKPEITVCVIGGDGGIYGEGLNHLIAAARMNINIHIFVSNNFLYSLTTGQTSPTTPKGAKTKSTPLGTPNEPVNPVKLLKSVNPEVFVESLGVTDLPKLTQTLKSAIKHPGFSLVDITQDCIAFGKQLKP